MVRLPTSSEAQARAHVQRFVSCFGRSPSLLSTDVDGGVSTRGGGFQGTRAGRRRHIKISALSPEDTCARVRARTRRQADPSAWLCCRAYVVPTRGERRGSARRREAHLGFGARRQATRRAENTKLHARARGVVFQSAVGLYLLHTLVAWAASAWSPCRSAPHTRATHGCPRTSGSHHPAFLCAAPRAGVVVAGATALRCLLARERARTPPPVSGWLPPRCKRNS